MHIWDTLRRRTSSVFQVPVNDGRDDQPASFPLPTNLKQVKAQHSEPQTLPGEESDVHTVRFFLYHVLTFKGNNIAKHWPQWVLETVAYWKGDGKALRNLEGDLSHLCPLSAGYAQLDSNRSYDASPSGDCRIRIGQVLRSTIDKLKAREMAQEKARQDWQTLQKGTSYSNIHLTNNISDTASIYPPAGPLQSSTASLYSRAYHSNISPNLGVPYNAHENASPLYSYAPSFAASRDTILHHQPTAQLRGELDTMVAYDSTINSPDASGTHSSQTNDTDLTSLPPSSPVFQNEEKMPLQPFEPPSGRGETCPVIHNDASKPRSINSQTSRRFLSLPEDLFHMPPTHQEQVALEARMSGALPQALIHSLQPRSNSVCSHASSHRPSLIDSSSGFQRQPSISQFRSPPLRYRPGNPQTFGTVPAPSSRSFAHSDNFAPSIYEGSIAPSIVSSARPVDRSIIERAPYGGICGQISTPQFAPIQSRVPPRLSHSSSFSYRSHTPNALHSSRQHPHVRTMRSFTGPLRSANNASVDDFALQQGEYSTFRAINALTGDPVPGFDIERDRTGRMHRTVQVPGAVHKQEALSIGPSTRVINPRTGQSHRTLYEQIEIREMLNKRR